MPSASTSHPILSDSPKHSIFLSEADSNAPPIPLLDDDPEGADAARQRLAPKSKLSRLFERGKKRSMKRVNKEHEGEGDEENEESVLDAMRPASLYDAPITLDASSLADQRDEMYRDQYEWAVVYENQRGMTIFSTPYYSSLSLLPTDPSPYTLPSSPLSTSLSTSSGSSSTSSARSLSSLRSRLSSHRSHQPPITLSSYPLPDGTWHWVSRCWMIDMRTDDSISSSSPHSLGTHHTHTTSSGHDPEGFEYNWVFRASKWRSAPGPGGAGGWVRRRRWVRLMVREARRNRECVGESRTLGTPTPTPTPTPGGGTPVMTPRIVETPTGEMMKRSSAWYAVGGAPGAVGEAPIIQSPRHRHSVGSSILSEASGITGPSSSESSLALPRAFLAPTSPSPSPSSSTHSLLRVVDPDEIFLGSVDADWERLRGLMRRFGRDGRKLECWRGWLGVRHGGGGVGGERLHPDDPFVLDNADSKDKDKAKGKRRQKQWTEDEQPMPSEVKAARARDRATSTDAVNEKEKQKQKQNRSIERLRLGGIKESLSMESVVVLVDEDEDEEKEVTKEKEDQETVTEKENDKEKDKAGTGVSKVKKEHLVAVLKKYTHEILHLFMYPDSRAEFIKLLGRAGVLGDLGFGLGFGGVGVSVGVSLGGIGVGVGLDQQTSETANDLAGTTLGSEVDFWSYVRALGGDGKPQDSAKDRDSENGNGNGNGNGKRKRKITKEQVQKAILGPDALPRFDITQGAEGTSDSDGKILKKEEAEDVGVGDEDEDEDEGDAVAKEEKEEDVLVEDVIERKRDWERERERDELGVD